jgi:hypothetical protein
VIQVRMRDEDVIDLRQPRQRQVAYAGAGVDQDIVIDEQEVVRMPLPPMPRCSPKFLHAL